MIIPTYNWQFSPQVEDADFTKIAKSAGLSSEVACLLYQRGIRDESSLKKFLEPSLEDLHDPYLLHDMDKAVDRIRQAIERGELILVYGDYDADGVTSVSLMMDVLRRMGADVSYYIPSRFDEGYGLNSDAIDKIKAAGADLIVNCRLWFDFC